MTDAPGSSEDRKPFSQQVGDLDRVLRLATSTLRAQSAFVVDRSGSVAGTSASAAEIPDPLLDIAREIARSGMPASIEAGSGAHTGTPEGTRAFLGMPVPGSGDQPYGALCVATSEDRRWSAHDEGLLADLAATAALVFQLRETTFVLGQQLLAQQLEIAVEDAMTKVALGSNRAWTIESVVEALVENGQRAAGAALISVLGKVDGEFRFYHGGGVPDDIAEEFVTMDVTEPYPMAHTCRTGEAVVLKDRASFADWPEFLETMDDTDIVSLISYPILDAAGDVAAVLGLGYTTPMPTSEVPPTVVRLGALMRQGLERAAAYQQERRHAFHLESLVIPRQLPNISNLELCGSYLPPKAGQRVGGDLYDVIAMPDGLAGLVVADATGHDIQASQSTVQLRHALGMLSHQGRSPSEVLGGANDYLRNGRSESLITCAYAQLDPHSGALVVVNAGHPHPRILRGDGRVEAVANEGGSQPLLGVMEVDYVGTHQTLERGDTLIMFTDGVVERRDVSLLAGEQALDEALADLGAASAETIVEALSFVLDDKNEDDVAILVARRI